MLTDHQRRALDSGRDLSVTANAGAGKTTVLVQRFVGILLGGTPVDRLVAITFTEKAAGELKKRIADSISAHIRDSAEIARIRMLEGIRDRLASARICTIHSFCAQLLREYPVEAGVDAAFTVIEGVDRQLLEDEAVKEAFEAIAGEDPASGPGRADFLFLMRSVGRRRVLHHLSVLLGRREQIEKMLSPSGCLWSGLSDQEILRRWNEAVMSDLMRALDEEPWRLRASALASAGRGTQAAGAAGLLREWRSDLPGSRKIDLYRKLCSHLLTKQGTIRKIFAGREDETGGADPLVRHFRAHGGLAEILSEAGAHEADASLLRCVRMLAAVAASALERYDSRKRASGRLDFDDLQLKARDLLSRPDLRRRIAAKYSYIMVDEFQDTNRLQSDIVRLLIPDFRSGNLFIVGDPKQSIYGFRNADVGIFAETTREIASRSEAEDHGGVTLGESFRLLADNVDFVNRIFSRTMQAGLSGFDVGYDELIKGRVCDAPGTVEFLLADPGAGSGAASGSPAFTESRLVASRLAALRRLGSPVYRPGDDRPHPFQWKDAAILLRSRTHLEEIERALSDWSIPYIVSGGMGFYQTQEILDVLNYLKFLLNPEDDVSLAGVLRSPFYCCSDAELFEVSLERIGGSFWTKLRRYAAEHPERTAVVQAAAQLSGDLMLVDRLPTLRLVQRIIERTGWIGTVAGLPSGEQTAANLRKLLGMAEAYAGQGLVSHYDFVERLKTLSAEEEQEGQAASEPSGNLVQVMTIHAAKGLEFPVVVLPFTHRAFRYDTEPFIDPDLGIAFRTGDIESPFSHWLRLRSRLKTEAEEKRIFYVGCTRARDMLVISGSAGGAGKGPSELGWVKEALGIEAPLSSGTIVLPAHPLKSLVREGGRTVTREEPHVLRIAVTVAGEAPAPAVPQAETAGDAVRRTAPPAVPFIGALRGSVKGEFFSATQIRTYLECPTKYYLKYVLGLPEENAAPYHFDEEREPDDAILGDEEGKLTHEVLRLMAGARGVTSETVRQAAARVVDAASLVPSKKSDELVSRISELVLNFIDSPLGHEVAESPAHMAEYTMHMAFGEDYLTGKMDLLYRNPAGEWRIIDYKTDRSAPEELSARAGLYKSQVALYSLLVARYFRQDSVRATIAFLAQPARPVHFQFEPPDLREFEDSVTGIVGSIKSGQFRRSVERCNSCSYSIRDRCLLPM